jgi:hypothetical protein
MAYLDLQGFKDRTIMPSEEVDQLPSGFILSRLAIGQSEIDSVLRKRYAAPFLELVPEVIKGWLTDIVTPEIYLRRGWDPGTEQAQSIIAAAARAREQMQQAANAVDGLWDIPLRENVTDEGVTKGGPLAYSEQSPYEWTDRQVEAIEHGQVGIRRY